MSWTFKIWTMIEAHHEETDTYRDIELFTVCLGAENSLKTLLGKLYFMVRRHRPNMVALANIDRWIKEDAEVIMAELEVEGE